MSTDITTTRPAAGDEDDDAQIIEPVGFDFGVTRRTFVQLLGAGLVIAAAAPAFGQQARSEQQSRQGGERRGGGRSRPVPIEARLHLGKDGTITVMTGKVEGGQGARAEITQAAAEELRVPVDRVQLIMADTALVPDDGITAGSRTTPGTLPAVRQACTAARGLLAQVAVNVWKVPADQVQVRDGAATAGDKKFTYADLASDEAKNALKIMPPADVEVTPAKEWKALGVPTARPNGRDLVTGAHQYPCDIIRPGMLYAKVLRPPAYGAKLTAVDLAPAQAMEGVVAVHDQNFVAVAAPTTYAAKKAVAAIEPSAKWDVPPQISSRDLYDHLRKTADGGVPPNEFADEQKSAATALSATYHVPYVQHAPMEPRAAVAEWDGDKVTVWTSTQNPFGVRRELAGAFHVPEENVRVIVPDFGGGFGGKHTGECAVEAARIAKAAKKPVVLRWTRAEEFTWAYFRPAAVIDVAATLDDSHKLATWYHVNLNPGPSALETPYRAPKAEQKYVKSDPPLRHGSYRALAATANTFARESFMDELAHAAKQDPLAFRLANLEEPRMRAVLSAAAERFGWTERVAKRDPSVGVGLACGTDKGSFVAACAEVAVDRAAGTVAVRKVCQVFECGAITNPANLLAQVQGGIVMGLGPALREAIEFERGKVTNATFFEYEVPRIADVPKDLDVHLLDRPDLPSSGAGETPLIAIAPAVGNAIFHATGVRLREMPLRLPPAAATRPAAT